MPRLDGAATTLGQELDLVLAYLSLMQMRMPGRLSFELYVDPDARPQRLPVGRSFLPLFKEM